MVPTFWRGIQGAAGALFSVPIMSVVAMSECGTARAAALFLSHHCVLPREDTRPREASKRLCR